MIFPDFNLKLAVIQSLREAQLLPPFDKNNFWEKVFGVPYDDCADYAYEIVPEVIEYYKNFQIPEDLLYKVTKIKWIEWDIVYDINSQWDGEDNFFQIASLEGIENCPNLEKIDLYLGLEPMPWEIRKWNLQKTFVSLKPLMRLKKLKEVVLEGYIKDVEVLLDIPTLKKITIKNHCKILEIEEKTLDMKFLSLIMNKK